jgi:hypothetical protein
MAPNDETLMSKIAAEGGTQGDYSYEEKLALVANNMMAPEEVGLASAEEAILKIEGKEPPKIELGNAVEFAASVVPIELRAQWAYQDTKIVLAPSDKTAWIENWIGEHKNEYLIQGRMHCGTAMAQFQRTFKDPVLGLSQMLALCGTMLEKQYLGEELPPSTEPEKRDEQAEPAK